MTATAPAPAYELAGRAGLPRCCATASSCSTSRPARRSTRLARQPTSASAARPSARASRSSRSTTSWSPIRGGAPSRRRSTSRTSPRSPSCDRCSSRSRPGGPPSSRGADVRAELAEKARADRVDGRRARTDKRPLMEYDIDVHRLIYRAAENPHLEETLVRLDNLADPHLVPGARPVALGVGAHPRARGAAGGDRGQRTPTAPRSWRPSTSRTSRRPSAPCSDRLPANPDVASLTAPAARARPHGPPPEGRRRRRHWLSCQFRATP